MLKKMLLGLLVSVGLIAMTGCGADGTNPGGSEFVLSIDGKAVDADQLSATKTVVSGTQSLASISTNQTGATIELEEDDDADKFELKDASTGKTLHFKDAVDEGEYTVNIKATYGKTTLYYTFIFTVEVQSPDLSITKVELFHENEDSVTQTNKLEAGENVIFKVTVKNIGNAVVPSQEEYLVSYAIHNKRWLHLSIPKLQSLDINKTATFSFTSSDYRIDNVSDEQNVSIEVNYAQYPNEDDKPLLFAEKNTTNNTYSSVKLYVHQTNISVKDLSVEVWNSSSRLRENEIDLSEDNVSGNSVRYCFKMKNTGEHAYSHYFGNNDIYFKTGQDAFGSYYVIPSNRTIKLKGNEQTEKICTSHNLPETTLEAQTSTFEVQLKSGGGTDSSDNEASLDYEVHD